MTRFDPAVVAEVMADNRPRLLAVADAVRDAIAKSDKSSNPTRKAA